MLSLPPPTLDPRCPLDNDMSLNIYNICKGRLGSSGGGGEGVVEAKEDIKHLTKIDCFAKWSLFIVHQLYKNIYSIVIDHLKVYRSVTVYFTYMLLK